MQNRRGFIKTTCAICAAAAGLGFVITELESCKTADPSTITVSKRGVTVPLNQMANQSILIIKSASLEYDIALIKKSEAEYLALQMICTHRQNPVTVSSHGFFCPSHGSEFDMEGNATKGPAENPLKKFSTVIKEGKAIISI